MCSVANRLPEASRALGRSGDVPRFFLRCRQGSGDGLFHLLATRQPVLFLGEIRRRGWNQRPGLKREVDGRVSQVVPLRMHVVEPEVERGRWTRSPGDPETGPLDVVVVPLHGALLGVDLYTPALAVRLGEGRLPPIAERPQEIGRQRRIATAVRCVCPGPGQYGAPLQPAVVALLNHPALGLPAAASQEGVRDLIRCLFLCGEGWIVLVRPD